MIYYNYKKILNVKDKLSMKFIINANFIYKLNQIDIIILLSQVGQYQGKKL